MVHERAAKRILRYLKGTAEYGILFNGTKTNLFGYSDADYAGDVNTKRSTSGYAFIYGGIVSWGSERQKCVALSTTESEYIAGSIAIRELVWLKYFLNELLLNDPKEKTDFYMDNQSAIRLIKNPELHKRSKHIDIRYHFIREKYEQHFFSLNYVSTENMIADIFTKSLSTKRFGFLRNLMNVISV